VSPIRGRRHDAVKLGELVLDGSPRAAVVIDRVMPLEQVAALRGRGADLLEIRLDLLGPDLARALQYAGQVRRASGLPLLGTIRENDQTRRGRLELFEKFLPLVDAVDVEVDADIRDSVVAMAAGKTVIVSEHDFVATPPDTRLRTIASAAVAAGAHVVKIAAMARSADDVARLMAFCRANRTPTIAIAMGEYGAISRVLAPVFGSLFSYTFVSDAVAPGQLPLDDLVREFRRYYPGYGA
jgi:3-dehydroquinate dehydratase I